MRFCLYTAIFNIWSIKKVSWGQVRLWWRSLGLLRLKDLAQPLAQPTGIQKGFSWYKMLSKMSFQTGLWISFSRKSSTVVSRQQLYNSLRPLGPQLFWKSAFIVRLILQNPTKWPLLPPIIFLSEPQFGVSKTRSCSLLVPFSPITLSVTLHMLNNRSFWIIKRKRKDRGNCLEFSKFISDRQGNYFS